MYLKKEEKKKKSSKIKQFLHLAYMHVEIEIFLSNYHNIDILAEKDTKIWVVDTINWCSLGRGWTKASGGDNLIHATGPEFESHCMGGRCENQTKAKPCSHNGRPNCREIN